MATPNPPITMHTTSSNVIPATVGLTWQGPSANAWSVNDIQGLMGPLREEQDDMPILARRQAMMVLGLSSDAWWYPVSQATNMRFGVDAQARCAHVESSHADGALLAIRTGTTIRPHAEAPDPDCSCGFYSVPSDRYPFYRNIHHAVNLLVELSGVVIEHDLGYRAQHQRVLSCELPPCMNCRFRPADGMWSPSPGHGPINHAQPYCNRCYGLIQKASLIPCVWTSVEELQEQLPVPITRAIRKLP